MKRGQSLRYYVVMFVLTFLVVLLGMWLGSKADARVVCGVHCTEEDKQTAKEYEHERRSNLRASHHATVRNGGAPDEGGVGQEVPSPWNEIAECESGHRWDYNGASGFDGGLQFHPDTWSAFSDPEDPEFAHQASVRRQIEIAERVLEAQGWRAWPACSRKLGLR